MLKMTQRQKSAIKLEPYEEWYVNNIEVYDDIFSDHVNNEKALEKQILSHQIRHWIEENKLREIRVFEIGCGPGNLTVPLLDELGRNTGVQFLVDILEPSKKSIVKFLAKARVCGLRIPSFDGREIMHAEEIEDGNAVFSFAQIRCQIMLVDALKFGR